VEKFLNKFFGFLKQKKYKSNKYTRVDICDDVSDDFRELIKKNRMLLSDNGVNLNKIRFIFQPTFTYDIDRDSVNPQYTVYLPLRNDDSGLFDKNAPVLEIGKPQNIVTGTVNNYKFEDNYAFIKELTKKTKRGIAIYIIEHTDALDCFGNKFSYEYGVDSEMVRLRDLDELGVEVEECEQIL